jgi:PTH1 family peptidyl-tRNA hydrolase
LGLGNPGKQYSRTRHNAGFRVIDLVSETLGVQLRKHLFEEFERAKAVHCGRQVVLVKPLTYMNNSGRVVRQVLKGNNASIDDLLVICDSLDLPAGTCRLKERGSSGGHRGLASIISCTGNGNFKRLYIGIGRPAHRDDVVRYVLDSPKGQDKNLIEEAIEKAARYSLMLLEGNISELMSIVNRKE